MTAQVNDVGSTHGLNIVEVGQIILDSGWDGDGTRDPARAIAEIETAIMCEDSLDFIGAQKLWYVLLRRWFLWMRMRGAPSDRRVVVALCKQLQTQIQPKV
jgi:hypothetical protein